MKKKTCVFMMMLCVASMAMGRNAAAEEDILEELTDANTFDAIVAQNGQMQLTYTNIAADGTESLSKFYVDDDWYVLEEEDGILIFEQDGGVCKITTEDEPCRYLFLGDSYESFKENREWRSDNYTYEEEEQILSEQTADGLIYLETSMPLTEENQAWFSEMGYGEVDSEIYEYVIDESTKEILELRDYAVSGEERTLVIEWFMEPDCEAYTLDENLEAALFGESVRTVSVVADAGTDAEKTYTLELAEGCMAIINFGDEFEETLYLDPECTVEKDESEEGKEAVYYVKRVEES